MKSLAI